MYYGASVALLVPGDITFSQKYNLLMSIENIFIMSSLIYENSEMSDMVMRDRSPATNSL